MGEAKRRAGIKPKDARENHKTPGGRRTAGFSNMPEATHAAVIVDRSARGREIAEKLKKDFPDYQVKWALWDATGFQFLVYVKVRTMGGQLSIMALTISELMDKAIPAIINKAQEQAGMCAFVLGVDARLVDKIQASIDEAGKAVGWATASTESQAASPASEGLLDLALAVTGRELDLSMVKVEDPEAFSRLTQVMLEKASMLMAAPARATGSESDFSLSGWVQDDGRLVIYVEMPDMPARVVEIPKGGWRELSPQEKAAVTVELAQHHQQHPEELASVLSGIADRIKEEASAIPERKQAHVAALDRATHALFVFDRSPNSLLTLNAACMELAELRAAVDQWLSTSSMYFLFGTGEGFSDHWASVAPDELDLLNKTFPAIAASLGEAMDTALLYAHWLAPTQSVPILKKWEELGGISS